LSRKIKLSDGVEYTLTNAPGLVNRDLSLEYAMPQSRLIELMASGEMDMLAQ